MMRVIPARFPEDRDVTRQLFREYEAWLGVDLCFQGFEEELAGLPGEYAPPGGALFLARDETDVAGCAALRRESEATGEMKRLFVRDRFRGLGLGRALTEAVLAEARRLGYARIRLDTLSSMTEALALYRSLGFHAIPPYRVNPLEGALFFELGLAR